MGMFGMFGSKKEGGADTGEYGSDQVGMMKMLAGMPHMMRKPMMKRRLSQLLSFVVIGLAVLLTVNDGPRFEGLVVVLFVIGFVFAVLVGLWSMWGLLRRDRR